MCVMVPSRTCAYVYVCTFQDIYIYVFMSAQAQAGSYKYLLQFKHRYGHHFDGENCGVCACVDCSDAVGIHDQPCVHDDMAAVAGNGHWSVVK